VLAGGNPLLVDVRSLSMRFTEAGGSGFRQGTYNHPFPALDWKEGQTMADETQAGLAAVLAEFRTESGRTLLELVDESPVLLIFLRHFACAFCAGTIDRVSQVKEQIAAKGVRPVFVHLGTAERAQQYFEYYKMGDVERVGNPDATLYQKPVFALGRTNPFSHFFKLEVLKGWFLRGAAFKYGIGMIKDDAEQMPGVFFLKDRKIVRAFRHKSIADEVDFLGMIGKG
jgi:hypothetical protein